MSDPAATDRILEALLSARRERRRCALLTVIEAKGSTPRKPGSKMLVFELGHPPEAVGTIGGGALEHELVRVARERIGQPRPMLVQRHLTHELGMCCGGGVTVLVEPQTYSPQLIVFGAGHVAQPLASVAALAGFEVTVVDAREALATRERFPQARRILVEEPEDVVDDIHTDPRDTYVVVVTHDHGLDERIAARILRRPTRFVGVIGSDRKREMFRKRLAGRGLTVAEIDRMRTPVGVDIEAETPAEIAVSIVAELIRVRRRGIEESGERDASA
jgi:xanthine dehydrogenase accessory factor